MIDFREFVKNAEAAVRKHSLGNGNFARWIFQDGEESRDLGINEYGCADAVNILYTINKLPSSYSARSKYIKAIQSMQNPETGLFEEATHDPFHTTADCVAALELLDSHPLYPISEMLKLKEHDAFAEFMDKQPWSAQPQLTAHRVAALYSALAITGDAEEEWQDKYFKWLHDNTDGDTGLIRNGFINYRKIQPFLYLEGNFHYMLNCEYKHLPVRYPARLIDTCIQFYDRNVNPDFGKRTSFEALVWIYCMNRAMRQTDYRYKDCKKRLAEFEKGYCEYLLSLDFKTDDGLNDLRTLFGVLCSIAELQSALPGTIKTDVPLRLVLDRRPFV